MVSEENVVYNCACVNGRTQGGKNRAMHRYDAYCIFIISGIVVAYTLFVDHCPCFSHFSTTNL